MSWNKVYNCVSERRNSEVEILDATHLEQSLELQGMGRQTFYYWIS